LYERFSPARSDCGFESNVDFGGGLGLPVGEVDVLGRLGSFELGRSEEMFVGFSHSSRACDGAYSFRP
jgi:hypothetical protein